MKVLKAALPGILALAMTASAFSATTTVQVKLWDKGSMMDLSKNGGMGMNMMSNMNMMGNMKMVMMGIDVDHTVVPAGNVTFQVRNVSKETIHEMLVAPVNDENVTLPYVAYENRVDEDAAGHLGEVSELDPGKKGSLTLDLKPGLYVLFCNVPGHFSQGMWRTMEVR